jgi:hypothetical protein
MMEVLQQDGLEPKPSLVLLVREQLGGANTEIYKSHTKWSSRNRAVFLGMQNKTTRRATDDPSNSINNGRSAKHREPLVSWW